jgi:hypothetical protein
MRTWKDADGRTWQTAITVGAIKRVRGLVGANLADLDKLGDTGEQPLLTRLQTDIVLLVDVLYAIHQPDAAAAGIDDEGFASRLSGDALAAANDAFWAELAAFFLSLGRREIAGAIQKQQALIDAAIEAGATEIERIDVDAEIARAHGTRSGSSPASSASTRPT